MQPDFDRLLRKSRSALPHPESAAVRRGIGLVLARVQGGGRGRRVGVLPVAIFAVLALAASLALAAERIVQDGSRTTAVTASPIVDRTVECSLPAGEGYPDPAPGFVTVSAVPLLGGWPPSVNSFGPSPEWSVGFRTRRSPQHRTGSVWISRACRASRVVIPLSSRGLRRVDAHFGARYHCEAPAKVRVRVRAVFTRPVSPFGQSGYAIARGTISSGSVAVRTTGGRPIFFGSAQNATSKASAFVARGRCARD